MSSLPRSPAALPAPSRLAVSSWEARCLFALAFAICLVAGLMAWQLGLTSPDALDALTRAQSVVHAEARLNLALIGFVTPPLPALLYMPLCAVAPGAAAGLACPLLGAPLFALTVLLLNALLADAGLRAPWRWGCLALIAAQPLVFQSAVFGHPLAVLAPALIAAAGALLRWARTASFRDLLTCSVCLTAALLTRYDSLWLALVATLFVGYKSLRTAEPATGSSALNFARAEGSLIAFALPTVYCAAVWIGAAWAILGDPWHFITHRPVGTPGISPPSLTGLALSAVATALVVCPVLPGALWVHLRRTHPGALTSFARPVAWLVLGMLVAAAVVPVALDGNDNIPWLRFMPLAFVCALLGWSLAAVAAAQLVTTRSLRSAFLPLALAALGCVLSALTPACQQTRAEVPRFRELSVAQTPSPTVPDASPQP